MSKNNGKHLEYATIILGKLSELFDKDNESNYHIDLKELEEGDNMTDFVQALANIVPNHLVNSLTNQDNTTIEFNHMANILVFQYSKLD